MAISKEEFEKLPKWEGKSGKSTQIVNFLKENKEYAYTKEEIIESLKIEKNLSLYVLISQLVKRGIIERRGYYFSFNQNYKIEPRHYTSHKNLPYIFKKICEDKVKCDKCENPFNAEIFQKTWNEEFNKPIEWYASAYCENCCQGSDILNKLIIKQIENRDDALLKKLESIEVSGTTEGSC